MEVIPTARTATYTALHDRDGEMIGGVADMSVFAESNERLLHALEEAMSSAALVVSDANLSSEAFVRLVQMSLHCRTPVFFDCTSDPKSVLPVVTNTISGIDVIKANAGELSTLVAAALRAGLFSEERRVETALALRDPHSPGSLLTLAVAAHQLMCREGVPHPRLGKHLFVTLGARGVLWVGIGSDGRRHYASFSAAPVEPQQVRSTSGAGDCFFSAIAWGALEGMSFDIHRDNAIVMRALRVARDSLLSRGPVPVSFSV